MVDRDKVIEMLSRGYSQAVVAAAVGCDDSYISQILADTETRDLISARRLSVLESRVEVDDSIETLEKQALARVKQLLPLVTKPMEALRIFEVMNKAEKKTKDPVEQEAKSQVVNITLPQVAAVAFKLSPDRQVVEIEGRSMATLPSQQLNAKLAERQAARTPLIADGQTASELLNRVSAGVKMPAVPNLVAKAAETAN